MFVEEVSRRPDLFLRGEIIVLPSRFTVDYPDFVSRDQMCDLIGTTTIREFSH